MVTVLGLLVLMGQARKAEAQGALAIQNVTLREDARMGVVLTIAGTGFGRTPLVTVDWQQVGVLPAGTDN